MTDDPEANFGAARFLASVLRLVRKDRTYNNASVDACAHRVAALITHIAWAVLAEGHAAHATWRSRCM